MFDDVRALYSEQIRRHGRAPAHAGRIEDADGSAKGDNPMCGDRVQVFIRRTGRTISKAAFDARGCDAVAGLDIGAAHDLAAAVETMALTGRCEACGEALQPLSAVHDFPSRVKCVTLPWRALLAAIDGGQEATSE